MKPQRAQRSAQRSQSSEIYLCATLRFALRPLRLYKKTEFNCVTPAYVKSEKDF